MSLILVTGGASSGKSRFALSLLKNEKDVTFIATGIATDKEMEARIEKHKKKRPDEWTTVEEPTNIKSKLESIFTDKTKKTRIIIDCLTFWVSNLIYIKRFSYQEIIKTSTELADFLSKLTSDVIVVTNELGMSIIPENKETRYFRQIAGEVNQIFAEKSNQVYIVISGIGVKIKEII